METIKKDSWKISDFTEKLITDLSLLYPDDTVSIHINTVGGWFKDMEERGIHYVNRASGEKVYDSQDLEIAKFIFRSRRDKFAKDIIYKMAPEYVELRPFPPQSETKEVPRSMDELVQHLKREFFSDLDAEVDRRVSEKLEEEEGRIQKLLPSPEKERAERMNTILAQHKVTRMLEMEAIKQWNQKPAEERTKKAGLFRKEEDLNKREEFIKNYVDKNFQVALENEFGLDEIKDNGIEEDPDPTEEAKPHD